MADYIKVYNGIDGSQGPTGPAGSDGVSITSVSFLSDSDGNSTPGDSGTVDTYEINYSDGTSDTFDIQNGYNGVNGNSIKASSGSPSDSSGRNGDLYIDESTYDLYEKASGTWSVIGNIKGATGDTGPSGASLNWLADSTTHPTSPSENDAYYNTDDEVAYIYNGTAWQTLVGSGAHGDVWKYGSGTPTDSTTRSYDVYYINTDDNSVHYKASGNDTWTQITTLSGALYDTTSSDSIDLSTLSVGSTITINVADSGLNYSAGQVIVVAHDNSNKFYAEISSYTGGTSIDLTISAIKGNSTESSWDLNLSGNPYTYDQSQSGTIFEVELPAYSTTTQRVNNITTDQYPDGWSIHDGSQDDGGVTQDNANDLIVDHTVTYSDGSYRPVCDAKIMYKSGSTPDIYVTLVGDAAYTKLANDTTNGKVELASLTTEVYILKIHLIFA